MKGDSFHTPPAHLSTSSVVAALTSARVTTGGRGSGQGGVNGSVGRTYESICSDVRYSEYKGGTDQFAESHSLLNKIQVEHEE